MVCYEFNLERVITKTRNNIFIDRLLKQTINYENIKITNIPVCEARARLLVRLKLYTLMYIIYLYYQLIFFIISIKKIQLTIRFSMTRG